MTDVDDMSDDELAQALMGRAVPPVSAELMVEWRHGVGTDKKIREILGQ